MAKIAYISSTGHSGSTLLDLLLGSQPGFESTGELILLPLEYALDRPCTCGQPISQCVLWGQVLPRAVSGSPIDPLEKMNSISLGWMPADVQYEGLIDEAYRKRRKAAHGLRYLELKGGLARGVFSGQRYWTGMQKTFEVYELIDEVSAPKVIVNSSKSYLHAIDHWLRAPDRVKVINLVRDGRAVYNSFIRHGFEPSFAVDAWLKHYERALPLFTRWIPEASLLTVRYEDLARDPAKEVRRIVEFMGESFDAQSVALDAKLHHNVNGNDARFSGNRTIRLDERWRRDLDAAQLAYFDRRAGMLNRRFGYAE